jgi:uncharacterized protein (TIGR02246 family)
VATAGSTAPVQADERAVRAVFDATTNAWADGDANAFVEAYGENATVILPGFHLRGKADILASMRDAFAGPLKGSRRIHAVRDVRFLGDEVAVVITRSVTALPGEAEPPAERRESATWVLSKCDGRWLVEGYHSCPAGASPQPN